VSGRALLAKGPVGSPPPRVSVVIASYEHEEYVEECIHSVLDQTFQDFEIVVTDDGSRDSTLSKLLAIRDERISVHAFDRNRGACIALNHAIRRARGEFVAILNSDDTFDPEKLAVQVEFLDAHPQTSAVFAWPNVVDERGVAFSEERHKDFAVFRVENRDRFRWLRHFFDAGNCLCHPTLMIRRRCYSEVGLYDARLSQVPDLDMWIRLANRYDIYVMRETLTRFRIRDGQRNASAARPEVIRRDAWERQMVARHYLSMPDETLRLAFPENRDDPRPAAIWLAERGLAAGLPLFGLTSLFDALDPYGDGDDYRHLASLTGSIDLFGLFRGAIG